MDIVAFANARVRLPVRTLNFPARGNDFSMTVL